MTPSILHCIYDDPANPWVAGGGAVRALEIYRRLTSDLSVTIATGRYPGARDESIDGVQYRRLGASRPYVWSRWTYGRAATRLIREGEYDAAIFDFSVYTPISLPRDRSVGLALHHLTGPTAGDRWGRAPGGLIAAIERRMIRRARWISFSSRYTMELARPLLPPDTELVFVGAGVSDAFFDVERREGEALLFFGRLDVFQKGLDTLIEAFALLRSDRPGLMLDVAGRGKDADRVACMAETRGVADGVRMLGPVSDEERLRLFAEARLALMPSRFEGFGMVAAEAMAAGVPLVASDAGSLPEVVAPPGGGVTVPADDPVALAAAAAELLDDHDRRAALSRSARESARRFSWDAVSRRHLEFVRQMTATADTER